MAFQIGDGKCVALRKDGTPWEPIPWDDRCFLNKTTSICDTDALSRFRCCYGGIDTAPVAIFLGSDGIDDSFGEEENLYNFYIQLAKGFSQDGHEATVRDLKQSLPVLSKRGSQDDMSAAGIYDSRILSLLPDLVHWKVCRLEVKKDELSNNIALKWKNILFGGYNTPDKRMAYNDIVRYVKGKVELSSQIERLMQEKQKISGNSVKMMN